jgi:hypothetical protein
MDELCRIESPTPSISPYGIGPQIIEVANESTNAAAPITSRPQRHHQQT